MKKLVAVTALLTIVITTVAMAQDSAQLPKLTLISNVNVFDSKTKKLSKGMHVLVKDNLIETVSAEPLAVVQTDDDQRRRTHADTGSDRRAQPHHAARLTAGAGLQPPLDLHGRAGRTRCRGAIVGACEGHRSGNRTGSAHLQLRLLDRPDLGPFRFPSSQRHPSP